MAKNKVSEPKGGSGRGGVRLSDRKRRQMKLNQRTYWSHYSVTLRGALSLAPDINTAPASAISGLSLHTAALWHAGRGTGGGLMSQQDETSRLFFMMPDHLTASRVETITALDLHGFMTHWLVFLQTSTHWGILCLCALTVYTKAPPPAPLYIISYI